MKPLCYCLYAGLHGWEEGFVSEGYRCIGFDIEDMCALLGQPRPDDCELVLRDVRSIHGAELKDADCIVGSSPCQEFSYRAMPWSRAKALPPPYLGMELCSTRSSASSARRLKRQDATFRWWLRTCAVRRSEDYALDTEIVVSHNETAVAGRKLWIGEWESKRDDVKY